MMCPFTLRIYTLLRLSYTHRVHREWVKVPCKVAYLWFEEISTPFFESTCANAHNDSQFYIEHQTSIFGILPLQPTWAYLDIDISKVFVVMRQNLITPWLVFGMIQIRPLCLICARGSQSERLFQITFTIQ